MATDNYTLLTIDAFTDEPFKGNPAAVCVLPASDAYPPDSWLLALAGEMNLSETVTCCPAPMTMGTTSAGSRLGWR